MPELLGVSSWAGCSISWPGGEGLAGSILRAECGNRAVCMFPVRVHSHNLLFLIPLLLPSTASIPQSTARGSNFSTESSFFFWDGGGQLQVCLEWERKLGMPDCFLKSFQTVFILDPLHSTSFHQFLKLLGILWCKLADSPFLPGAV